MSVLETHRFADLARALGVAPRHLLVAMARLARSDVSGDPWPRRAAIAAARSPAPASDQVAALLMTPIASFALDETDRALALLWPTPGKTVD